MEKGLPHNHILGLGIDKGLKPTDAAGMLGMEKARQAAALFVEIVAARKVAGKALLIAGDTGSGKTALAVAISRELGPRVPFVRIVGSELFSAEVRRAETLRQALRRATSVRIREVKKVYEGELLDIKVEEKEDPLNSYRKRVSIAYISLKSLKGSQRLSISSSLYQEMLKEKILIGDVIYIEPAQGVIRKIGRSDSYASEFDIGSDKYVPLPRGDVMSRREVLQEISLHEIDVAHATANGEDIRSIVTQMARPGKKEIPEQVREEVDEKVSKQIISGAAEISPGVLFIDEAHTLDTFAFSFLASALEESNCPIVVLATNRGKEVGFGLPREILRRVFLIEISPLGEAMGEAIEGVIKAKINAEQVNVSEDGVVALKEIAKRSTLRRSFSLLSLAVAHSGEPITGASIEAVAEMFSDSQCQ